MEAQAPAAEPFPVPGLTPPTKRTGVKRRIGDVIVQLGFAERELVERVVADGHRDGVPLGQALIEAGIVELRAARPGARRAQRARLRRPERLRRRQGRHEHDRRRQGAPIPDDPDRLPRRAHAARGDRGSREPAGARRHHDGHRLRGAPRGGLARGHRRPDREPRNARGLGPRDRGRGRGGGHRAARVGGRRAGREARARRDRRCGAPRRLGHPLRAARERHARALPRGRRGVRLDDRPAPPRLRPRLPDQDHGRARHRREARAAGRPHRPVGGRQLRGPARGDPAGGARRVGGDAHPRLAADRDGPRPPRHGRRGPRPLRGRDRRHARRDPRDRADGVGQDHDSVRRRSRSSTRRTGRS